MRSIPNLSLSSPILLNRFVLVCGHFLTLKISPSHDTKSYMFKSKEVLIARVTFRNQQTII